VESLTQIVEFLTQIVEFLTQIVESLTQKDQKKIVEFLTQKKTKKDCGVPNTNRSNGIIGLILDVCEIVAQASSNAQDVKIFQLLNFVGKRSRIQF
jgi:hypothetical protein